MADFTKHSFAKKNRMKTDVLLIGSGIMSLDSRGHAQGAAAGSFDSTFRSVRSAFAGGIEWLE